jgi:hypothetical protein
VNTYSYRRLTDGALIHEWRTSVSNDRTATARLLALLGEVMARKLYVPAGYPSMFAWCVAEFHMSEDVACKRIRTARAARRFPVIFAAIADGRLHVSGVSLLARYLTEASAGELLAAAMGKTKREIEQLLAERYPQQDLPTRIRPLVSGPLDLAVASGTAVSTELPAPGPVTLDTPVTTELPAPGRVSGSAEPSVPAPTLATYAKVSPLAPERFALQVTIPKGTHDKLRRAQELLGHQVAFGDLVGVLDRALDLLVQTLEKRKFAASDKPRQSAKPAPTDTRHIPADVKRAVRKRDHDQCTFVSGSGQRCPARAGLEFDHIEAFANGGRATVGNLRLRCRAHNQYTAEIQFGAEFMKHKRESARRVAESRARATGAMAFASS